MILVRRLNRCMNAQVRFCLPALARCFQSRLLGQTWQSFFLVRITLDRGLSRELLVAIASTSVSNGLLLSDRAVVPLEVLSKGETRVDGPLAVFSGTVRLVLVMG